MTENLNSIERGTLGKMLKDANDRIAKLERIVSQLSANKIFGGTLTVKNITDGVKISILDPSDVEIGTIDENGLIILDGNMSLENDSGDVTIDNKGIVSMENFFSNSSIATNNEEITSGTLVDVTDAELTTVSFARTRWALAFARVINSNAPVDDLSTAYGNFEFELQCDAEAVRGTRGFVYQVDAFGPGSHYTEGARTDTLTLFSIVELGVGTHTIKVQAKTAPGTNMKSTIEEVHVGYMVLGT